MCVCISHSELEFEGLTVSPDLTAIILQTLHPLSLNTPFRISLAITWCHSHTRSLQATLEFRAMIPRQQRVAYRGKMSFLNSPIPLSLPLLLPSVASPTPAKPGHHNASTTNSRYSVFAVSSSQRQHLRTSVPRTWKANTWGEGAKPSNVPD